MLKNEVYKNLLIKILSRIWLLLLLSIFLFLCGDKIVSIKKNDGSSYLVRSAIKTRQYAFS